ERGPPGPDRPDPFAPSAARTPSWGRARGRDLASTFSSVHLALRRLFAVAAARNSTNGLAAREVTLKPIERLLSLLWIPELLLAHAQLEERVGDLVPERKSLDDALELLRRARVLALREVALAAPVVRVVGVRVVGPLDEERRERVERFGVFL